MENVIECIARIWRIQTPGGIIVEIESDKPLSSQMNAKLLEEEEDINEFFKQRKILRMRQVIRPLPGQQPKEESPRLSKEGTLTPRQRINQLLKMKGEFTRQDYIDYLFENFKYKLNKWISHRDIKDAVNLHKIEIIAQRKGKTGRLYKVIDTEEIEESLYQKLLQDRKLSINTLT